MELLASRGLGLVEANLSEVIEWDVKNWSAALQFWSTHTTKDLKHCHALELGSRNGGLSLWMALQGAHVVTSDFGGPSEAAFQLHRARQVSQRIQYQDIDATNIPYTSTFDIILFKSLLGAVGDKEMQAHAVRQMHKALKDGGELFFAENLSGSALHQFLRKKFVKWGETWRYLSISEIEEFFSPFSSVQYQALGFAGGFGRSERQRTLLSRLDRTFFAHVVPENWKYIVVGVAKK